MRTGITQEQLDLLTELAAARDLRAVELMRALPAASWTGLLDDLRRHGLGPLVADLVARHGMPLPETVRAELRAQRDAAILWHAVRTRDLDEVVGGLSAAGIPHMLLKGSALALTLYERPWHRAAGDTDILVPHDRAEEAQSALTELGYAEEQRWEECHHLPYLRKGDHPAVEIHHNSLYAPTPDPGYTNFPVPFERLAEAGGWVTVLHRQALVPSPVDSVLQLCSNFTSHMEESPARPLRWVRDLALLLSPHAGHVTWEQVVARCEELAPGIMPYVALTAALAEPFLAPTLGDAGRRLVTGMPRRHRALVASLPPDRMIREWHASPLRALSIVSKLMGPRRAARWALRKVFVSREHIARQLGRDPTRTALRFYPAAFVIHAVDHLRSSKAV